jgi:hypothetical protein
MMRLNAAIVALVVLTLPPPAMAIEEAPFKVVETQGKFELREYAPYVVAETFVEGEFESVGNEGFRRLVRYISGANVSKQSISMTAPVEQSDAGEKIAMTAPVEQAQAGDRWRVAFVLPSNYTIENAPAPTDARIELRTVPARLAASVRYSGRWTRANYETNLALLQAWIREAGWIADGEAVWARYNPPMMPWFLRRNEIVLPVRRADAS